MPARSVVVFAAALVAGCGRKSDVGLGTPGMIDPPASATISEVVPFVDRTGALGIDFAYSNGADANENTMLESLGGGVGWLDFDRDGWLDLVATGGGSFPGEKAIAGRAAALFRNLDGRKFVSAAVSAGIESAELYTNGVAIADYDNDGFQEVLITGYGRPQLWRNMGDGTFQEFSEAAGILDDRWGSSAGWADLNGDGNLDLYLAHYVNWSFDNHPYCTGRLGTRDSCPPREFDPLPDCVYYSEGDGRFTDATEIAGLRQDGKGLGVLLFDVEPDGDVDIYVANDTTDNFLYVNDGGGRFREIGVEAGVARDDNGIPNGSMGIDVCDFNGDGLPDIWVANYERESFALYRNEGHDRFLHVSQRLGITDLGGLFVGFGTACEDFDSDGDQDMVIANGHVIRHPANAPRKQLALFMQYDGRRFQRAHSAPGGYFGSPHEGRGLAVADFDADGDLDIAISQLEEPIVVLANEFRESNDFLSLNLIGVHSNRDAVGTRVELQLGNETRARQITGGGSYLSHSARNVQFALPAGELPRILIVHWPSGRVQRLDASALAGEMTLLEAVGDSDSAPRLYARKEFK